MQITQSKGPVERRSTPMSAKRFLQCAFWLMLCYPTMGNSQIRDTTLQGQVVDASGASLPGVRLLVVNLDTLEEQRAVIKANGKFMFPHMPPGDYALLPPLPWTPRVSGRWWRECGWKQIRHGRCGW